MNREEDTIDLGRLLSIIVANKKVTGGIVAICTVLAVIVAFILPKTYTSSVMVQTGSSKSAISSGAAALAAMTGAATGKAGEYIEIMKTRTVLEPIIASVYDDMDIDEQPTVENFAKSNLDIKNTKGTNLIQLDEICSLGVLDIQVGLGKILHCRLLINIHIIIDTGNNRLQHSTGFHDFYVLPCLAGSRTGHGCQCRRT